MMRFPNIFLPSMKSNLGISTSLPESKALRCLLNFSLVTVARFEGAVHDLTLSAPPVREQVYSAMRRWLGAYVLR